MLNRLALIPCCLFVLVAAACGGGGGDDDSETAVPTRDRTVITTQAPRATPAVDIREIDVALLPEVAEAVTESGGTIVQTDVIYADVTNDGFDDAIVPVTSGGTLGYIGFFVITPDGETGTILLQEFPAESAGLTVSVVGEKVEFLQPAPGPDDPECCPSFFRRTVFAWNGNAIAVESVTTELGADVATLTPTTGE